MNSSGIKRGLATTAVTALAIAGLPLFASSASAVVGDSIAFSSAGPVRNAGTIGGKFVFKTKGVDPTLLKVSNTAFTGSPNNPDQSVAIVGVPTVVANGAAGDSDKNDGLDEITAYISVTGASYNFGVYEDEANPGVVDAGEPRTTVSGTTTGAPATFAVAPTFQSAPVATNSDDYTVTVKDAAGNTTQLSGTEVINIAKGSGAGAMTFTDSQLDATELATGTAKFKAQANSADLYTISLTGANGAAAGKSGSASLDVSGAVAAGIPTSNINIVTGADTFTDFGNPGDGTPNTFDVRPDQSSVTVNIKGGTPGQVVILNVNGTGVTFGGQTSTQVRGTVQADGTASISFTVDAASIQTSDSFAISGSTAATLTGTFAAPAISSAKADQTVYISSYGGTVNPVVTVKDQFGNPISGVFVTYQITSGPDAGAESARTQVGPDGKVTFAITDTKATALNMADGNLTFKVYAGQFDAGALATDTSSKIVYSSNGQGADFLVTVDGQTPGGAAYNPSIQPLTDTTADNAGDSADETASIVTVGGTTGAAVTVTADNGGLILTAGQTRLSQAKATVTGAMGDTFRVIGTKAGTVNLTIASGGKTKTATVAVKALSESSAATVQGAADLAQAPATARNIAVTGPDAVVAGSVVEYVVTITDAFGNPVKGFSPNNVNVLLTGPAATKGNSGVSDAAGKIKYSVELDQDAKNPITFQVTGTTADFGAAADRLTAASTTNDGTGLTASKNVATATATVTNLDDLKQAVKDAQAALDAAKADLASAQGNLDVAKTELAVAQANVDALTAKKADLKQKLKKADTRKEKRSIRKKLRAVNADLKAAQDAVTVATAKVAAAQTVVDQRTEQVAAAQAALDEAQKNLDDAQK